MPETLGCLSLLMALALPAAGEASQPQPLSGQVLEIRSYNLKAGTRDRFHDLFVRESLPLLRRWKVDVVGYGPSLHDQDSYFLMRSFPSSEDRDRTEQAFYDSPEWRNGPRAAVLGMIEGYTTIVFRTDNETLKGLRGLAQAPTAPSDLDLLLRLNDDYIESAKSANVKRFTEILADDFLCTLADGSFLTRAEFLEVVKKPSTVRNLRVEDVNVRLMGDFAIVHARTAFTLADDSPGSGRYTDVWARRKGQWVAVAAHVTRK